MANDWKRNDYKVHQFLVRTTRHLNLNTMPILFREIQSLMKMGEIFDEKYKEEKCLFQ